MSGELINIKDKNKKSTNPFKTYFILINQLDHFIKIRARLCKCRDLTLLTLQCENGLQFQLGHCENSMHVLYHRCNAHTVLLGKAPWVTLHGTVAQSCSTRPSPMSL